MTVRVGELGMSNPAASVSGHVLIESNTLLPRHGNGNTNNTLGYERAALELSRFSSVTVSNNYIGCEESIFATNGTTTVYDFCGILAVNASAQVNGKNPSDLNIIGNRFQFNQAYSVNESYSTGPLINVINYWEGAAENNAPNCKVTCTGNTFHPRTGINDGKVIYYDSVYSVIHSNNTHSNFGDEATRDIPLVRAKNVQNFNACGNTFSRQTTAFDMSYPKDGVMNDKYQNMKSCIINNNSFGQGVSATGGGEPCCRVSGNGPCMISNNSWFRVNRAAGNPNEGALIEYTFTVTGGNIPIFAGLIATGNIMSLPQTVDSWYRVNGAQGAKQPYICTANNILNGVTT
jgi:hypothetical protein